MTYLTQREISTTTKRNALRRREKERRKKSGNIRKYKKLRGKELFLEAEDLFRFVVFIFE